MYVCIIQLKIVLVQQAMHTRFTSVVVACGLLCSALPLRAQYALNKLTASSSKATGEIDPEEAPKSGYKVVHGVVQGQQGALPGATVWLHGSRTIAVANAEGEFELRVPADAKIVELTCGYGGLEDEVVRLAPAQALGSVYLLRNKSAAPHKSANN